MYAIIEVGGLQYKVAKDQKLRVPKIDKEVGKSVELKNVLLFVDKDKVEVGKPIVKNISVKATILSHGKDKKVIVFKKIQLFRVGHLVEGGIVDQLCTGYYSRHTPRNVVPRIFEKFPIGSFHKISVFEYLHCILRRFYSAKFCDNVRIHEKQPPSGGNYTIYSGMW